MDKNEIDRQAIELHAKYRGKIQTAPKVPVKSVKDFVYWYTPGVAAPCLEIHHKPEKVFEHTNRENTVAIVTDGTRVLGLGDIGPEASLPVMEGKALIFKYLGGVDAVALPVSPSSPGEFIRTVQVLEPGFGGINLEDISQPKCFGILDKLRSSMNIPVWHDDQQGTALVVLAGFINAVKLTGKDIRNMKVVLVGAGAANINIARLLIRWGLPAGNLIMTDSRGIITRTNREADRNSYREKYELSRVTNAEGIKGDMDNAFPGADAVIALSVSRPGTIKPENVKAMNKKAIVFTCANPLPEIWPGDAKAAGAFIVATGRSDFPNQVNNSLGFPGLFRGVLDVRASQITDSMCITVASAIAEYGEKKGLSPDYIIPSMDDHEMFEYEAVAAGMQAVKEGLNRIDITEEELRRKVRKRLQETRKMFE